MSEPAASERYCWGAPCDGDLSIGLCVSAGPVAPAALLPWRWALRTSSAIRTVTIRHPDDRSFRVRVRVTRAGDDQPLWEFFLPPPERPGAGLQGDAVTVMPGIPVELAGDEVSIDASWGPGRYRLQLVFGGPDFTFECRSGAVELDVR